MTNFDLELCKFHMKTCPHCLPWRACIPCWRKFGDTAQILARTPDAKRARA